MRYQLRYIRAQRARSSPGAKHDDSPVSVPTQIPCSDRVAEDPRAAREHLGRPLQVAVVLVFDVVRPLGAGPVAQWKSVRFTRGRSLVRSQPGPQLTFGSEAISTLAIEFCIAGCPYTFARLGGSLASPYRRCRSPGRPPAPAEAARSVTRVGRALPAGGSSGVGGDGGLGGIGVSISHLSFMVGSARTPARSSSIKRACRVSVIAPQPTP
jgi:hypothetical protein